jgi:hypothetical protein
VNLKPWHRHSRCVSHLAASKLCFPVTHKVNGREFCWTKPLLEYVHSQ